MGPPLLFVFFLLARPSPPTPDPTPSSRSTLRNPRHNTPHPPHLFRQSYTQYIPLSVHQLKDWAGTPAIFVLDCSAAGVLLKHFVEPPLPMEEGDDAINPDTPPRGDGSGGSGSGAGGVAAGSAGGPPSDLSEQPCLAVLFLVLLRCCKHRHRSVCPHVLIVLGEEPRPITR